MHTDAQCAQKVKGIKIMSDQLKLSIKDKGSEYALAESISIMCEELLREFDKTNI